VEIADTGKGILESELPYIFDVFHRASGEGKGLGLGLAIVKQIMDAHGEHVAVQSIPGQGTVFRLSFPKA
jgi:signal transduction histidine kinase